MSAMLIEFSTEGSPIPHSPTSPAGERSSDSEGEGATGSLRKGVTPHPPR